MIDFSVDYPRIVVPIYEPLGAESTEEYNDI